MTFSVSFPFARLLHAPDGGLPGMPGSGSSGDTGPSLPGIPGSRSGGGGGGGLWSGGDRAPHDEPAATAPLFTRPEPPRSQPPGQPGPTYELSGWWRRVGATLLDGALIMLLTLPLLVGVSFLLLGASTTTSSSGGPDDPNGVWGTIALLLVTFATFLAATLLYAPFFMARWNGATPGKRVAGIRVVREDGAPITFGFAAVREIAVKGLLVGGVSSAFGGLPALVDYLWPLWDPEHRALHDMLVKTRVVRDA